MKVVLKNSFIKDIKKLTDLKTKSKLKEILISLENISNIHDINNLEKIKGHSNFFRIRVGNHRIGVHFEDDNFELVRFLHRKDIYKYFPN
jgi:mRNA interferase RelE/StbE